ncbi:hypothetical protein DCS_06599 [Drechmeria coniospora]|uniref:NAD(P)-binding domain-containing protein n=1 Tax=Drechmeria coniospora TaxID=98403 RepID=A0A151GC14_DRECN|nr:hypothetical protein DCS_06599 [Drechmeria coniospora]KYK54639.1 hypothetical protein DCS_06599 [Drechmeria coniospora]
MAVKVFLTGATGYIGGTALDHLIQAHPEYEYTVLVRDKHRAEAIGAKYPAVKYVFGTLDDHVNLEEAAAKADVVVHTAESSDHYAGALAIAKGLKDGHSPEHPGYWIHTSGTSILTWYDAEHKREGAAPLPKEKYHDIDDIERLVTLPDAAHHRDVDKIAIAANSDLVKVAILCPPTIYGAGTGPVNRRSRQVPSLLVEATQDPSKKNDADVFGPHAYFFVENGSHAWADVAQWIADEATRQGYLPVSQAKRVSEKEVTLMDEGSVSWGRNSKGIAMRARRHLDWEPRGVSLKDTIAEVVAMEAHDLGLSPKGKKN